MSMLIRVGFELSYDCPRPTPMILTLSIHESRAGDCVVPDRLVTRPEVPLHPYRDTYGNLCTRLTAPAGTLVITTDAIVEDDGEPDETGLPASPQAVERLPDEVMIFLLGSRYCETDRLSQTAWDLFGQTPEGWPRVQAISDYVHRHLEFGYEHAGSMKSAADALEQGVGVCRDFTHLAVAFCRCMNIPARYCTGYLSDIGVPPPHSPPDFAAWFEAFLDGRWYVFDPRNGVPRRGRVLMARGRDAADVPLSNAFGSSTLTGFKVWTEETDARSLTG